MLKTHGCTNLTLVTFGNNLGFYVQVDTLDIRKGVKNDKIPDLLQLQMMSCPPSMKELNEL